MPFSCTICAEESTTICARCTQDTCRNHLCERCHRCSDCCECEVQLQEDVHEPMRVPVRATHAAPAHTQPPDEKDEEDWQPPPDPDPLPPEDPEPGPVEP